MIVNGNELAQEVIGECKREIGLRKEVPTIMFLFATPDAPTKIFLDRKIARANELGIPVILKEMAIEQTTANWVNEIMSSHAHGIVVQLPIPAHLDKEVILNTIPPEKDIDVLGATNTQKFFNNEYTILPPVVAAIKLLCKKYSVVLENKKAVIIGQGKLVGFPASIWLRQEGADVIALDEYSQDFTQSLLEADIIVLGAGSPSLLKPEMIKEGVVIFDAGTSEQDGKVVGDADPSCATKARVFTPTPGGIGPLTVAMVYKNLISSL